MMTADKNIIRPYGQKNESVSPKPKANANFPKGLQYFLQGLIHLLNTKSPPLKYITYYAKVIFLLRFCIVYWV